MDPETIYVVTAMHSSSHGETATVILITGDIVRAVETAREAELYCTFNYHEHYVWITRHTFDRAGWCVHVFKRYQYRPESKTDWREEWYDSDLQKRFEKEIQ